MSAVPTAYEMPANGVISSSGFNAGVKDAINFGALNRVIALMRATGTQSIPNTAWTAITFDVEDVDTADGHSTSSNTSRYTAVYAGWYWGGGSVGFSLNATGARGASWYVNGSAISPVGTLLPTIGASFGATVPAPGQLFFLNVGDYVELRGFQNSGGALNTQAGSAMSIMWAGTGPA